MEWILILFTTGYIVQHFGSAMLIIHIRNRKNIQGLSLQSQVMYFMGALMRLIYVHDTRLLKFFMIWIELVISVALSVYIFYLFHKYRHTRFHQVQNTFISWKVIVPACAILSIFLRPGSSDVWYTPQIFVSMSMFIEACGLLPQLYICKKIGSIEADMSKYLSLMGLSRVIRLGFWILNYLNGEKFLYLIVADIIHTVIIGDVMYMWLVDRRRGQIMI